MNGTLRNKKNMGFASSKIPGALTVKEHMDLRQAGNVRGSEAYTENEESRGVSTEFSAVIFYNIQRFFKQTANEHQSAD